MLNKVFETVYLIFAAVLLAIAVGGIVVVAVFYDINALHIIISAVLWGIVFYFIYKKSENRRFVIGVIAVGILLRILYAIFCTQPPQSDFKLYVDMAASFSEGNFHISDYARVFPHTTGYSLILSGWFKMLGSGALSGRLLNVFFDAVTVMVMFKTSQRLFGERAAGVSATLFSLSPSLIMYCGLVCTEKASVMLIMIFMYAMTYTKEKPFLTAVLCPVTAIAANMVRPNGAILLITLVLTMLVIVKTPRRYICIMLSVVIYIALGMLYTELVSFVFGDIAENPVGWNIYVGFNAQSYGQWNENDAMLLGEIMNTSGPDDAHRLLSAMAFDRICENGVIGNIMLLLSKFAVMWSNDIAVCSYLKNDIVYGSLYDVFSAEAIISGFYINFVVISFTSAVRIYKSKIKAAIPVILFITGTAAMHLLSEVMGRYAYPAIVCMLMLCGISDTEKGYTAIKHSLCKLVRKPLS